MDNVEQLLRDELRAPTGALRLDGDRLLAEVGRRRRRHRLIAGGGTGIAVALVAALAGPLLGSPFVDGLGRTVTGRPAAGSGDPTGTGMHGTVVAGRFRDATHGSVLRVECDPTSRTCGPLLRTTADGGRTWRSDRIPVDRWSPDQPPDQPAEGAVRLFEGTVVVDWTTLESDRTSRTRRWVSRDDGRTWAERPGTPQGEVDQVPVGGVAYLHSECAVENCPAYVVALRPDGTSARLRPAVPPTGPLSPTPAALTTADDGSLWAAGGIIGDGPLTLARSTDRGRTWAAVQVPTFASPPKGGHRASTVLTRNGRTVYLDSTAFEPISSAPATAPEIEPPSRRTVYRSDDAGRTWREVGLPDRQSHSLLRAVLPDGGLLLTDADGRLVVSDAGAGRFEEVDGMPTGAYHFPPEPGQVHLAGWVSDAQPEPRGSLDAPVAPERKLFASTDGRRWREVAFG